MKRAPYFTVENDPKAIVVTILHALGAVAEDEMRDDWKAMIAQVEDQSVHNVVVDFGNIDYFGSVMLELLVLLARALKPRDGHLVLCNLSKTGVDILKIARFDTIFPITNTRQSALELLP